MITYKFTTEDSDLLKICSLYKKAGWWEGDCSVQQVTNLLKDSFCFITAWDEETLVGMGRVISDAYSDAYIQDIFVDEAYRKQGIASQIVKSLTHHCQEHNVNWIALIAAPGSVSVYEKLGFKTMKDHTPMKLEIEPENL
ncbi:MAG: GNAT family N-acetyltransferase [Bacteroidota bacterium]